MQPHTPDSEWILPDLSQLSAPQILDQLISDFENLFYQNCKLHNSSFLTTPWFI